MLRPRIIVKIERFLRRRLFSSVVQSKVENGSSKRSESQNDKHILSENGDSEREVLDGYNTEIPGIRKAEYPYLGGTHDFDGR